MSTFSDKIAAGASFTAFRQVCASIMSLVTMVILIRYLGTEDFGYFALAMAYLNIASMLTGNFHEALRRFIPEYFSTKQYASAKGCVRYVLCMKLLLATLFAAGVFSLSHLSYFQNLPGPMPALLSIGSLYILANTFQDVGTNLFMGMQRYAIPL